MISVLANSDPSLGQQWLEYLGPFHPVILHLPIGLYIGALLMELTRAFTRNEDL